MKSSKFGEKFGRCVLGFLIFFLVFFFPPCPGTHQERPGEELVLRREGSSGFLPVTSGQKGRGAGDFLLEFLLLCFKKKIFLIFFSF